MYVFLNDFNGRFLFIISILTYRIITERLACDRPAIYAHQSFSFKEVFCSLTSPHVIISFVILFCHGTILYGLALFLPSIVNQLGFSPKKTQLISVGPYAVAFIGAHLRLSPLIFVSLKFLLLPLQ